MDSDPPSTTASAATPFSDTLVGARPDPLSVPRRFLGPPASANGGYLAGRLAAYLPAPVDHDAAVTVTLRTPPPLETPMRVEHVGDGVQLFAGGTLVAEAVPGTIEVECLDPVPYEEALRVAADYPGRVDHPFPTCFVCGIDRAPGDGLRLAPGPVGDGRVAAAWVPDASLPAEGGQVTAPFAWAAMDCPGGWTVDLRGRPMVLGRMTARVDELPHVDDTCVVMGQLLGRDGRKAFTSTTLYDGDGRVLARAKAVWIEVDPAAIAPR